MVKIPVDDHGSRIQIRLPVPRSARSLFRRHIKAELVDAEGFISGSDMPAGQIETAQHKCPVFPYKNRGRPDPAVYHSVFRAVLQGAAQVRGQADDRPGIRVTVFRDRFHKRFQTCQPVHQNIDPHARAVCMGFIITGPDGKYGISFTHVHEPAGISYDLPGLFVVIDPDPVRVQTGRPESRCLCRILRNINDQHHGFLRFCPFFPII